MAKDWARPALVRGELVDCRLSSRRPVSPSSSAASPPLTRHHPPQAGAHIVEKATPELTRAQALYTGGGFAAPEAWHVHRELIAQYETEYDPRVASRIVGGELLARRRSRAHSSPRCRLTGRGSPNLMSWLAVIGLAPSNGLVSSTCPRPSQASHSTPRTIFSWDTRGRLRSQRCGRCCNLSTQ